MPVSTTLTSEQRHALFDILSHSEAYSEIEGFKYPEAVTNYGFPFSSETIIPPPGRSPSSTPNGSGRNTPRSRTPVPPGEPKKPAEVGAGVKCSNGEVGDEQDRPPSSSPLLQTLFTRFLLRLPWLRDLPQDFWCVRVQGILSRLAEAELSESFDKGALGLRKTLATGSSSLLEMLGRGAFGGLKKKDYASVGESQKAYDLGKAEDLERAFDDFMQGLVYGDTVKKMCDHMVETDDLEAFSPASKPAAQYAIIYMATFLHQIFVISPEGQYLLQLLENLHSLVPYKMVRQTLRIGNVTMMINGLTRLMLAKVSLGGITNYFGLTTNADDGMNLSQRIISLILSWDAAEFRKTADKVEKAKGKGRPDEEMLKTIRQFINDRSRLQHQAARAISMHKSQSIITTILTENDTDLTEEQHTQCLEYYSALLSVQDRDGITAALCRQQPDLFSQVIRDLVTVYEPFISMVHTGVDLKEYLDKAQAFIDDFIKASKPKTAANGEVRIASVEDYVELLRNNIGLLYSWIHDVASKCPGVWKELEVWGIESFAKFQQKTEQQAPDGEKSDKVEQGKSDMDARLEALFESLPESSQNKVLEVLDTQASYLANLTKISQESFQHILDSTADAKAEKDSQTGPGNYLHRWQNLLDETDISPETVVGPVRKGKDVKHTLALGKTSIIGNKQAAVRAQPRKASGPAAPDVSVVVEEMGQGFLKILQEIGGPGK